MKVNLNAFLRITKQFLCGIAILFFAANVFAQESKTVEIEMFDGYSARGTVRLSPERFFLIEFPPNDSVLFNTSNNDALVKSDDGSDSGSSLPDGRLPVLFRPGTEFTDEGKTASLIILMRSGAVLNLDILPVSDNSIHNDRLIWKYDPVKIPTIRNKYLTNPKQVIAEQEQLAKNAQIIAVKADKETGSDVVEVKASDDAIETLPNDVPTAPISSDPVAQKLAFDAIQGLDTSSFESFPKIKPVAENPDIYLSALSSQWIKNGAWTLSVIGVQNRSRNTIRLLDYPRLGISTRAKKGESINEQSVTLLAIETSSKKYPVTMLPGEIVYFSFVYETPVLGSMQNLQVFVSHTNLADKPAIIYLVPGGSN